jgi:FAD/FMN-containing dehydrogenase
MSVPASHAPDDVRRESVLDALRAALGPAVVLAGADVPDRNAADATALPPTRPLAVVRPATTEAVSDALRICHAHGQPVVLQGGLTGLAGAAHPFAGEVALSLERMVGIEAIDPLAGTLTALAGTPLQVVQQAAEEAGFQCGIDLPSRGSAAIGGAVATNAGGLNVLRYGMARRQVLGLEVVLADGTVVRSLHGMVKNNAGYDWTQMFIGSEGTLGVITRVVLALHPRPANLVTALCAIASFEDALVILRRADAALPGGLMAFEAMWADFLAVATDRCGVPNPLSGPAPLTLLVEIAGGPGADGAGRVEALLEELLGDGLIADAVIAKSQDERRRLWALRETPADYRRHMPPSVGFDVSIPLARMSAAVDDLRARMAAGWPTATSVFFGHVADSNLHLITMVPDLDTATKTAIEDTVYRAVASFGGSVSAEHGIGRTKRPYLALTRSEPERMLMGLIKRALDPSGILGPGRVL